MTDTETIQNRTYDEIRIGDQAAMSRTLTKDDISLFAAMSGDFNPTHFFDTYAAKVGLDQIAGHGMWSGALISAVLGNQLPGPGTVYRHQDLAFHRPVSIGDTVTVTVTVRAKHDQDKRVVFDCVCANQAGLEVVTGVAEVIAPTTTISGPKAGLPDFGFRRRDGYQRLIQRCAPLEAITTAVVHPCDRSSLLGAIEAAEAGLIEPVLIGPEARIRAVAAEAEVDLAPYRMVATEHSHAAADEGVALARAGEVEALMKGSLHTDELMGAVMRSATGLRTQRRISHAFLFDVPAYDQPLIITDAAINIYPTLEDKVDIVQNAIDLAHVLEFDGVRVAILSAVETVFPKISSTIEAAALCKMADRGQITGGVLDGPLAFDNAINEDAARTKHIVSPVAGRANILVVPDLESGNMLAKQLTFFARADAAGIVLGARVPIVLTSRADNVRTRMASCAVAVLMAHARRRPDQPAVAAE
jgi:phosphate acetyltransferase